MRNNKRVQKIVITSLCSCVIMAGVLSNVGATDSGKETEISTEAIDVKVENFKDTINISTDKLKAVEISEEDSLVEGGTYLDKKGNLYKTSEDGKLESFLVAVYESDESKFISEDTAVDIATECLEVVADAKDYELIKVAFYNDTDYYRVEFGYHIGEYETTDRMYFEVDSDGTVIGYNAVDTGKFEDVSVELRDKDAVLEEGFEKIQNENNNCENFELNEAVIVLEDGIPCYSVSANCVDKETGDFEIVSTIIH